MSLSHAEYTDSIPKVLFKNQLLSLSPSFISILSKSDMGETKSTIYSEANLFSYEPAKSNMLCASEIQRWGRYRIDTPLLKERNRKEKGKRSCVRSKRIGSAALMT